jgi:threonine dehydrogenase-like Zn-dependent dehydrogenase
MGPVTPHTTRMPAMASPARGSRDGYRFGCPAPSATADEGDGTVPETVPALHLSLALHHLAVSSTVGRLRADRRFGGPATTLRLRELPRPPRPRGWVRVAPDLAGICASDRAALQVTAGRPLEAFFGRPRAGMVLGHEVVGTVLAADRDAGVQPGDRVVPEPLLACHHKGFPRCARCLAGDTHRCARQPDAGSAERGLGFGFHARFGGGWSTELVVPADRVHRVPDHLDDTLAVLTEPTAVAVHAVLRDAPRADERILVIGPGTIGLSVVHALGVLAPDVEVVVASLSDATDAVARRSGASALVHGTREGLLSGLASQVGSRLRGGRLSGPVLDDGFDVVYDCVGSAQTLDDALRALRPGGRLVLLGAAARRTVDLTLVWHRELTLRGSGYYADEDVPDDAGVPAGRRRAFAVAMEVLAERQPRHLVTHRFRLDQARDALAVSAAGPAVGAVKVAFEPQRPQPTSA